jgi:hypothetical protein
MKVLIGTPENIEALIQANVDLAKAIFPTLGRTIEGEYLVNLKDGKDWKTKTKLRYDECHYDEGQDVHYTSNPVYAAGFRPEFVAMLQLIINKSELTADNNFTPTQEQEPNNITKEP